VLCLHGYQQNAAIFREKSGSFRSYLKRFADFVYMDAPHKVDLEPNTNDLKQEITCVAKADYRAWWHVPECYNTKEVKCYEGFSDSVSVIIDFIQKEGPFDGILGFSQGAALAFLLAAMKQKGELDIDFKFLILISGFPSRHMEHFDLNKLPISRVPCLHVYGLADEIISCDLSKKLVKLFDKEMVVVVEHPGGHMMPSTSKYKTMIDCFFGIVQNLVSA
ncbi:unnamed protein product, partial [Thelazia callipaeda]|uniref:FSH1 domain-containing protein n=1 Tax=Thelazia callipaeda TaxID=103827 RepID=A0A0N5D109_THECL